MTMTSLDFGDCFLTGFCGSGEHVEVLSTVAGPTSEDSLKTSWLLLFTFSFPISSIPLS